jgi:hypothetical protein|tara:strand:- start:638 stop:1183 length:546 start_codon:yes stop_codon:yes gene_type:complete
MPVDPNTGNRLPYEGEPGYEDAKKKFPDLYAAEEGGGEMPGDEGPMDADAMMEAPAEGIVPERDLKPAMDKADEMMAQEEGAEGDMPEGDMPEADADMPEAAGADDLKPLMETLGMSQERAEEIMMAAQSIPQYAEMGAQELADLLSRDFQVLMELERAAASMAKPQAPEAPMMEPEAPMA